MIRIKTKIISLHIKVYRIVLFGRKTGVSDLRFSYICVCTPVLTFSWTSFLLNCISTRACTCVSSLSTFLRFYFFWCMLSCFHLILSFYWPNFLLLGFVSLMCFIFHYAVNLVCHIYSSDKFWNRCAVSEVYKCSIFCSVF